ncbi:SpoIIE family protein phosphatase [Oxalobacter sp. OttesenSCG-928-P03]|nr:SpoIIE family protein phosphatase [Oxalobacter sp. OttesenSCG-928-P03]
MKTIRSKILFVTLALVVLLGSVILFLTITTYERYKRLQVSDCRSLVDSSSALINKTILQLEGNARDLALMGEVYYQSRIRTPSLGEHIVIRNFENQRLAIGGGIWFEPYSVEQGRERVCFYAFDNGEKVVLDPNFESTAYYYPLQSWYTTIKKGATEKGKVVWTAPYVDEAGTHTLMMTLGAAIHDRNGRFVGMSTVDWELDAINRSVSAVRPTPNSFALFADQGNDFILVLSEKGVKEKVTGLSLKTIPWFNEDLRDGGEIVHNGVKYLTFFRTLANNMIIVVNVPEDELFRDINENLRNTVIVLLVVGALIAILTYWLLHRFISRPIAYLSAKAAQIGAGDLHTSISLDTEDELASLAASFNKMTVDIREHIQNLRTITAEKERIATELDVAREIQASMLPSVFPPFPERHEFDIYATMESAKEVGGDFYDLYLIDDDHLAVVIGDVSDKGIPAALFMVITKTLIQNYAYLGFSVSEIFSRVNNRLCESNEVGMFVTAFMGILNVRTGLFSYVNAGHNPPFVRRAGGQFEKLDVRPGFVLAGMEDIVYHAERLEMAEGDCIFMYTDGVTEASNPEMVFFEENRLEKALASHASEDMTGLLHGVRQDLDAFAAGAAQHDDITMLGLAFLAKKTQGDRMKEVIVPASVDALPRVLSFVGRELDSSDCSMKIRLQLEIAVEEIFANIAYHAYQDAEGERPVVVQMAIHPDPIRADVCFKDRGTPYNPLRQPDPDITLSAEERDPGGLGVYMAKKSVDRMAYEYFDGQNVLTITKYLL